MCLWPQWASYQIRKIAGCACAGNAGNVFPRRRFQRKLLVSDPGMHHGTCVTHVPWCMSGSLTCGDGENVPGIPGACAPAILRIWQEAHAVKRSWKILTSVSPLSTKIQSQQTKQNTKLVYISWGIFIMTVYVQRNHAVTNVCIQRQHSFHGKNYHGFHWLQCFRQYQIAV